jgi:translocation and assembly module TamB
LKALRITGLVFVALLVLAAGVFSWAIYTQGGARALLALSRRWLPAGLTVEEISGTVAGTLHVRKLRYRDTGVGMDLEVDDATLETAALALLSRRLHVERAQVNGVRLALFPATTPSPPKGPRDPWLAPLDMQVDVLRLTGGELKSGDATPFVVRHLELAASWIGGNIEARSLELETPDGSLTLSARVAPPVPRLKQLRASFRWRAGEHEWSGVLDARGAPEALQLDATLESPVALKLGATLAGLRIDGQRSDWRAHVSVPRFDPHPLVDTDAFRTLAVELDAEGDLDRLALRGTVNVDEHRVAIEKLDLRRSELWLDVAALRLRLDSQPAALTGHARWSLDGSRPSSAEVAWDELRLPDAWAGANFRCAGKLAMTRAPQGYAVNGLARLARGEKYSNLTLRVDGSKQRLRIQELELTQLPGSLSVTGDVDLAKPLRWQLAARARAFDPASFFDAWPGALDFDLATQGEWAGKGPRAQFKLDHLQGRLRARAISGSGDVKLGPGPAAQRPRPPAIRRHHARDRRGCGGAAARRRNAGSRFARRVAQRPARRTRCARDVDRTLAGRRARRHRLGQRLAAWDRRHRQCPATATGAGRARATRFGRTRRPRPRAGGIQVHRPGRAIERRRARA